MRVSALLRQVVVLARILVGFRLAPGLSLNGDQYLNMRTRTRMLLLLPILLYKSDVAGILLFILVSETDFALPGIINSANTSTGAANESRTALGGQKHCTWIYEEIIDHVSVSYTHLTLPTICSV